MEITVDGQTFILTGTVDGYYVGAQTVVGEQGINYGASPTVITFDHPIGPIDTVDLGEVYQAIKAKLGQ